jgi:hypothetical protein
MLQTTMAEKNQDRKPEEYKPEFEPGDLLLVWEKASSESRLKKDVRRLEGDKGGALPGKLRNPWQGPFKMLRWGSERTCIIDHNGKEVEFNVNRLTKQYEWDADHPDTSNTLKERVQTRQKEPQKKRQKIVAGTPEASLKVGDMVIFPKAIAIGHRSPFGIGQILEVLPEKIRFQWFGNCYYNANGIFQPGWINLTEDLGYYGRKLSRLDVPWTGEHTEEILTLNNVIAAGPDFLGKDRKLTAKARKIIGEKVGAQESWKQIDE